MKLTVVYCAMVWDGVCIKREQCRGLQWLIDGLDCLMEGCQPKYLRYDKRAGQCFVMINCLNVPWEGVSWSMYYKKVGLWFVDYSLKISSRNHKYYCFSLDRYTLLWLVKITSCFSESLISMFIFIGTKRMLKIIISIILFNS